MGWIHIGPLLSLRAKECPGGVRGHLQAAGKVPTLWLCDLVPPSAVCTLGLTCLKKLSPLPPIISLVDWLFQLPKVSKNSFPIMKDNSLISLPCKSN